MAPPGRQKSEREFCLFGGGFCARRAAPCAGLAVLARPAAVMLAFVPGVPAFFPQALHTRGDSLAPSVLFACRALCVRSSVLFWLSVCLFRVGCTRVFLLSFIFCLFLPNFFLSNFFSFVAQAATGVSLLVPSRGFVPGPRVLSSAAFSRAFAPIACFSVLCCSRGFSLLFFTFSCLTSSSQTSFHLSLRPRRGFPCLSPPVALFPACGPLISFCPTRAAGTCPPCALCAQFRLVLAVCLPVLRCLHAHFSLIFRLFLFGCCLSNFFSFVAQAATGLYFLPKRK